MSGRGLVLVAGNRQLSRGLRWVGLFLLVWGGIFAGVPVVVAFNSPHAMRGGMVFFAVAGLAAFFGGLYLLLRRREVRFDPARRVLEDTRSFLGHDKVDEAPLAAFECVSLEARTGQKGGVTWTLALRGPNDKALLLGEGMGEHGDAVAAGLRAAAVTGLPLDELETDGDVVRLRPAQVAQLSAAKALDDARPWWRSPSALALVAANLVPLAGVLWLGWAVLPLMLLFWLENLIVGAYTIARMLCAKGGLLNLPLCAFFAFHYGGFAFGHGLFLFAMFGDRQTFSGPSDLPRLVIQALSGHGLFLAALALVVSHGVSFVANYLLPRAYEHAEAQRLMFAPYKRVVVLHVVILIGGFLVRGLGEPLLPLVMLIVFKIAIDLGAHLAEHSAPLLREYKALAESAGVVMFGPNAARREAPVEEREDRNDRPLAHYLGAWRLAPGQSAPPGWFETIVLEKTNNKLAVRLTSQPGAAGADILDAAKVQGEAARIEWIEVRLHRGGPLRKVERILRFTAAGAGGERIELHEVQQPAGNPRAMQAKSFTLVRAA